MAKQKLDWCVLMGQPSWHQQRAGHRASGIMCFGNNRRKAVAFLKRVRKMRPDEPAFLERFPVRS